MEFLQVDVFADAAYGGNPLAVFPEAGGLSSRQMQAIASEMNLSETTFVTSASAESYEVRIFTPGTELPFAGHPTLGTAWVLRHLGVVAGEEVVQRSGVGETRVSFLDDLVRFTRTGSSEADLEDADPEALRRVAQALGLEPDDVGLEARELGRPGRLRPAFADAGLRALMVPVRSLEVLGRCEVRIPLLERLTPSGAYCFTAWQAGRLRARGLFPSAGVAEDPATGSAAAALAVYLQDRLGDIDLEILQGQEIGRPSRLVVRARQDEVSVAGRCVSVLRGSLDHLPST